MARCALSARNRAVAPRGPRCFVLASVTGQPRASKIAVIHKPHEHEHVRSRVGVSRITISSTASRRSPARSARRPRSWSPTSPERYRVQFTVGKDTHDKLRRLQALLRREIPNGDPAAIFDRAVTLLLEKVEREKIGAAAKARPIRPGTDRSRSRHTPNESKRVAWRREGGQCGFVAPNGHRCAERAFMEFHHIEAFALGGPSTPDNIGLRCRRHNQYEAERVFGPRHCGSDMEAAKVDRRG